MNRPKPIIAVYMIVKKDSKILMLLRKNTGKYDGNFSLPAGHVESGESLADAVTREAKEELNIDVSASDMKLVHALHRNNDSASINNERLDFYFQLIGWSGDIVNNEPGKSEQLKWFPIDQLPINTAAPVKAALDSLLAGNTYSDLGWD